MTTSSGDEIKACGNCRFFVAGGQCQRVIGEINAHDLCDLWSLGQPQALGAESVPTFEKTEVAYRGALIIEGWPPKIEGTDSLPDIDAIKVPDTGYPPVRPDPAPRTEPYTSPESRKVDKLYEPYLTVMETGTTLIQEAQQQWDEGKHKRNEKGEFANTDGTQGSPKEKPVKPYGNVPKGHHAAGEGGKEEPIEISATPTEAHVKTADMIMEYMEAEGKTKLYTRDFMIEQARAADVVRQTAEFNAEATVTRLQEKFPNAAVSHRVKKRYNMLEKMIRKPETYKQATDLKDVGGMRMIFPTMAGLQAALPQLRAEFGAHWEQGAYHAESYIENEDEFLTGRGDGYRAVHYDFHNADGTIMELQVRTPNNSKWADWYHDIYKPPTQEFKAQIESSMDEIKQYAQVMSQKFYELDNELPQTVDMPCPEVLVSMQKCL